MEVDIEFLRTHRPLARPIPQQAVLNLAKFGQWAGAATPRRVEGFKTFEYPVIFATNHTHVLDFLPLWIEVLKAGQQMVGWVKARMYKQRLNRVLMRTIGSNIPLVSKGYLIAADFRRLMGCPPTSDEYRHLRDHIDYCHRLPAGRPYERIQSTPRDMLGRKFDPKQSSYREAMVDLFFEMMKVCLDHARTCSEQGYHMHIYPEGAVSKRMGPGHTGIIHAALALNLPIVPVGISGTREAFAGNTPLTWGGEFRLRFGERFDVNRSLVSEDFRPFHPDDQIQCDEAFQEVTDRLMQRLNELLDEDYKCRAGYQVDGPRGVKRFY